MIALCLLKSDTPKGVYFVAEQVLLLLLGTYKSKLLRAIRGEATTLEDATDAFLNDASSAEYCLKVSEEVFRATGYVPATQRASF
jgi:hypothetical protein